MCECVCVCVCVCDSFVMERKRMRRRKRKGGEEGSPRFRVGVLFMSPAMKEDSVCLRTVSFHILRIRLWNQSEIGTRASDREDDISDTADTGALHASTLW